MRRSTSGFSVVEAMVGASILVLVLFAANNVFKPIVAATKKARILSAMMKIENLIREGVYIQTSYSDLSQFEIKNGNTIVAKHGVVTFLNEDLSLCNTGATCALQSQLEVVDFSGGKKGVIYRVAPGVSSEARLIPLGVMKWPSTTAEKQQYMLEQSTGNFGASSTTVVIPPTLVSSSTQKCENGFIRGVSNGNQLICWNFVGDKQCPSWSVPVGYRINDAASTMELLCQKLNRLTCPVMSVSVTHPTTGNTSNLPLENFYSLNKLEKSDLYPPRALASTGTSECRSIVNFTDQTIADSAGIISAARVNSNAGKCPDVNLYRFNAADGTCLPNFNPAAVSDSVSAVTRPNTLPVMPASELRALGVRLNEE